MFQKIQAIFIKLVRGTEFGIKIWYLLCRFCWYLHNIEQYSTYLGPYTNKLEFHSIQSSILDDFFSHAAKFSSFIFHLGTNWSQSVIFQTGMKTNSFFTHLQAGLYSLTTIPLDRFFCKISSETFKVYSILNYFRVILL